jgi:hypothetical protein
MKLGLKIAVFSLFGFTLLAGLNPVQAQNPPSNKSASAPNRSLDLKDLPLPVIDAVQKEVPKFAYMTVEKQTTWRRVQYYRIWGMDEKQRQIYLEVSAAGKVLERPKVIKQKETPAKEQQGQAN